MTVIHRTKNGWLLAHNHLGYVNFPEVALNIMTFHNDDGLMAHLEELFGRKQERDAKGHFRSTKKKEPHAK